MGRLPDTRGGTAQLATVGTASPGHRVFPVALGSTVSPAMSQTLLLRGWEAGKGF